ncbi:helix-turn-helix domain-containing protein [Svornostia abyssi]|uniref:helix-turn-helix domain-containing protein n=1 Tax=Svornostia abyssi TaxID=2898438 RepID=UPI00338F62A8
MLASWVRESYVQGVSGSHAASSNGTATASTTAARRPARDELDLLTPEDVARLLKVPTSTVYGLCREARIPPPQDRPPHRVRAQHAPRVGALADRASGGCMMSAASAPERIKGTEGTGSRGPQSSRKATAFVPSAARPLGPLDPVGTARVDLHGASAALERRWNAEAKTGDFPCPPSQSCGQGTARSSTR